MQELIDRFWNAYYQPGMKAVHTKRSPKDMILNEPDKEGWFEWKLLRGKLDYRDYKKFEKKYKIKFPNSFIEWHRSKFFLDGDCSFVRLPFSPSNDPLSEIIDNLNYDIAKDLIKQKLYPFASEGNDAGPYVFDGRQKVQNNEFPIRFYELDFLGDIEGLGPIIFSSFTKLLECTAYFLEQEDKKDFEIYPDFKEIDPEGAGKDGAGYWDMWTVMQRENFEYFS